MPSDISGVFPNKKTNHFGMTIGEPTINWSQSRVSNSGIPSPNMVMISGLIEDNFSGIRLYTGDSNS